MDFDGVEHQGEAAAALQAVFPAVLVRAEGVGVGRVQVGAASRDAVAPAAVDTHVGEYLAGMEVHVDLRQGGNLEDFDAALLGAVHVLRSARVRIPLEAESLVAVGEARCQREIRQDVEHLAVFGEHHRDVVRVDLPGPVVPGRRIEHIAEGHAVVDADHHIVVDRRLFRGGDGERVELHFLGARHEGGEK